MSAAATLRLYEAVDALDVVRGWLEENWDAIGEAGGELPPELEALIDQAEGDFAQKVERVALYIRELETSSGAVKTEADRLSKRAQQMSRAAIALKNGYLKPNMEHAGRPLVKGSLVTVRVQASPPHVVSTLTDEQLSELAAHDTNLVATIPASYRLITDEVKRRWQLLAAAERALMNHPPTQEEINQYEVERKAIGLPLGVTVERGSHVRIS